MKISTEDLRPLLSVAAAMLDSSGVLLDANAGFLRLLGPGAEARVGSVIRRFFLQPGFSEMMGSPGGGEGELYRGLMTIGDMTGESRTLRGRVWRAADGIRLLAEHDVEELERIGDTMHELNRESLLSQRALGLENIGLKGREAQIVETSLTDMLTGVGNRRKLDQALVTEIARATRTGSPFSAMMADIDHFKAINDRHGHAAGDRVLTRFGELLRVQTRPTDIVARFGGEEFIVLMPHTGLENAIEVAERIRKLLASERSEPQLGQVTTSCGVAQWSTGQDAPTFLHRMDAALYQAKASGRDQVVVSASPE